MLCFHTQCAAQQLHEAVKQWKDNAIVKAARRLANHMVKMDQYARYLLQIQNILFISNRYSMPMKAVWRLLPEPEGKGNKSCMRPEDTRYTTIFKAYYGYASAILYQCIPFDHNHSNYSCSIATV